MTGPQISLVMIVRNESLRLAHCLESVKNQVDEIIIVDTGSSDDTLLIAKHYTEKVYSYPWNDDFSSARNYALAHATCDWVLSLDADEQLHIQSTDLHSLIRGSTYSAFCLPLYALKTSHDHLESDRFMVLRLFQRGYSFKGAVHEYLYVEDPKEVGYVCHPIIFHTPVSPTERHIRRGRNIRLLQKEITEHPTDSYLQYYLGTEWLGVRRTHLAIGAFEKALRQFTPEQTVFRSPTIRHLISSYKDSGKLDEAICLCLQESQHYPNYCDLFFDGGVLFELKKEYEIASKWFQAAVALPPPPLPFFHTDGTNGYLAYYHLGYCAEKLGLVKEAESYYEQTLKNNNWYYYPLYQLILLKLTKESPSEVLTFLKRGDYLIAPEVAEKISELFWIAGFPDIGLQCLENIPSSTATNLEFSARYQLYSGNITLALHSINKLRDAGLQPSTELTVDEIIGQMILGNFNEAKKKLLTLWQMPSSRDVFRAVFCLYKKIADHTLLPLSNQKAATILLDLQNKCLRLGRMNLHQQQGFAALMKAINELLTKDEKTFSLLLNALYDKEKNLIKQLDYHCTAVRSFY